MKYKLGLSAEPISVIPDKKLTGVGMIRSEYLCRACKEYITTAACQKFVREYVSGICKIFYPHEVWYRTTDMLVPEVNTLLGADSVFQEKHFLMGSRGIRRAMKFRDTFRLELKNISAVAQEYDNLHILFPYIYDSRELELCIDHLKEVRFPGKYGIMAEIPSTILTLEKFATLGPSNITIGINDLTSLTLGTSRQEQWNPEHPAVIRLIEMAKSTCDKFNIPLSVGGHISKKLEVILNEIGVDSLIVHYHLLPDLLHVPHDNLGYLEYGNSLRDQFI